MRNHFITLCILVFLSSLTGYRVFADNPFTPGNIVVLRVGDGTVTLSSATHRVFLDEFTPSGALVQSISIPFTGQYRLTMVGSNVAAGWITRSPDAGYLVLPGFDTTYGIPSIQTTSSANVNRKILRVDNAVNYFAILSSTAFSGGTQGNIRGACMNGNDYWGVGDGAAGSNGVQYLGTGTPAQVTSITGFTNLRAIDIHNNQLFHSQNNSTFRGISQVGTGLPTTPGQPLNQIINNGTAGVSDAFAFSPDNTVCYLADERTDGNGGVQKWVNPGTGWTLAGSYTISCGLDTGASGLTVDWSGTYPVIYITTFKVGSGNPNNALLKIVDVPFSPTVQQLATAGDLKAFRGVAFAPVDITPVNLSVSGTVTSGQSRCYGANHTITVAGNNTTFQVQPNGTAQFIAGLNIDFLPGTHIYSGGQLTTQIRPGGPYCGGDSPLTSVSGSQKETPEMAAPFRVYPNPTNGCFTIERFDRDNTGPVMISVSGILGRPVTEPIRMNGNRQEVDIHGNPGGIYFVKLTAGNKVQTVKLILTN